jgi:hypothetical protein
VLHFLIGVAVCIFIGERLWHYWSEWRFNRADRRYIRWLQGESVYRSGLAPFAPPNKSQPLEPPSISGPWRFALTAFTVLASLFLLAVIAGHG